MNKCFLTIVLIILNSCNLVEDKNVAFDRHLKTFYDYNQFNGSAIVSENGNLVFNSYYGNEKINNGKDIDRNTVFSLGKISRIYTVALALRLVELNILETNKVIGSFKLPYEIKGKLRITVEDLIKRKSGLQELTLLKGMKNVESEFVLDNTLYKGISKCLLMNKIGEKISNETTDFIILGKIIENVTGLSFKDALEKYLFKELNLKDTFLVDENKEINGYFKGAGRFVGKKILCNENMYPVVGICATTKDLYDFLESLFSYKFIEKSFVKILLDFDKDKNTIWGGFYNGPFNMDIYYCNSQLACSRAQIFYIEKSKDLIILISNLYSVPPFKFDVVNGLLSSLYNLPINDYFLPTGSITDYLSINYGKVEVEKLIKNAKSLMLENKRSYVMDEQQIKLFCRDLVTQGKTEDAILVGKFAVEIKPKSSDLYVNLAILYSTKNDFENAKKYSEIAYDLNRWNRDAMDLMQRLKKGGNMNDK